MKTICGHCVSLKEISLSKAAKILSKFVSAENGASHVISAYLHRASASFNELDHLHKELKSSRSHKKKNKGQRFGSEYADDDDEKSAQTVVNLSQELDGSIGYQAGNVGGSEKHKKNKKKKQEVESRHDRDSGIKFGEREGDEKPSTVEKNDFFSGQEQGNEGEKQKKEKKKKHKDGNCNFSGNKGEVENLEGENTEGQEQQKEIEKKLFNSVEGGNGGLVGPQDLQIKKKRKHEAGNESKLYAEEVKMEQRRKRKNDDVEGIQEDRSGDLSKKRMKRKHQSDPQF
ncbi:uncharacterized protein LOC133300789 [Gastrolobium bilobum]|uniref:uncharacterized protein LOC133299587 n=1 Tax=Gastrolobium bilobum TaxID=150636 RepID=UPI002AAFE6E6|nr:uncharacterized protein LOC133299587 [Gastrolobium bilobum]XP_061355123.1 uncharacterized protein LOC133299587 [Gastrolobium bilobum]XP_061355183.1 uncharacterized protein LOC133299587 [Gastrolobium bilobum]XP_061355235.1 uncharacterized protein LOC133299587 [Gastrolobium bilobum]XP_061356387.1 uncharacterized protein LOC133300789 [Gastrolobium bilobum]